jgi:hypothetical protein
MLYDKQNDIEQSDNNALPTENTDKLIAKAEEIPQENTADATDENEVNSKSADEPDDMNNEVIGYDRFNMRDFPDLYIAPVTIYPIPKYLPVETAVDDNEDNYYPDEIVLDPDNFEYFKGVSSNNSEPNFMNR